MPYSEQTIRQLIVLRNVLLCALIVAAVANGILFYFVHQQGQQIQRERRVAIVRQCQDQNERHAETISILDAQIQRLPPDRRARAEASRSATVLLIDALAPLRDCDKLADKFVKSTG